MSNDLYETTDVIKLTDKDFLISENGDTQLKNKSFKNKDGYVMFYANWCPNCQSKADFWSYMGNKFNKSREYANENFRVGAVNTEDPDSSQIVRKMDIAYIPRFVHVDTNGNLSEYKGKDYEPETILSEVCQQKSKLCKIKYDH